MLRLECKDDSNGWIVLQKRSGPIGHPLETEQCIGRKTKRMADCKLSSRRSIHPVALAFCCELPEASPAYVCCWSLTQASVDVTSRTPSMESLKECRITDVSWLRNTGRWVETNTLKWWFIGYRARIISGSVPWRKCIWRVARQMLHVPLDLFADWESGHFWDIGDQHAVLGLLQCSVPAITASEA